MPENTQRIDVHAPADQVFRFVSDVKNMPRYLPTVRRAEPLKGGRVALEGEANGHPYRAEGWIKVDHEKRVLSWGAEGDHVCQGQIRVRGDNRAEVICTMGFDPDPATRQRMEQGQGGPDAALTDGMNALLQSIKQICEATGGKVKSSAEP